jgi:hypothetical protein
MANVEILTKQAHQIAMRKENGTRAMTTDKRFFLSKVRVVAGNPGVLCGLAHAFLS